MPKGDPILPNHPSNPVGQTRRIRQAVRAIGKHAIITKRWLKKQLSDIPVSRIEVSGGGLTVNSYRYQINLTELRRIVAELQRRLDDSPTDYVIRQVLAAKEEGTALAIANLANLTDDYTRTITSVLTSRPYQRSAALVRARMFEEMKGFDADNGRRLARILMNGVLDGRAPRDVAKDITKSFGTARSAAERLARTEITGAMRRARWDEAEETREKLGIRTKLMHLSAFSPTTRDTHAARHGELFTVEEVRAWYEEDGNAINCKCTQVEVLVDEDDNPVSEALVERVRAQKTRRMEDDD